MDIYRRGAPTLVAGSSEYTTPRTLLYSGVPCRRVQISNDIMRNNFTNSSIGNTHKKRGVDAKFYVPYYHNTVAMILDPSLDLLEFECALYEIIREKRPSGGNISGIQESYITLYCSIYE